MQGLSARRCNAELESDAAPDEARAALQAMQKLHELRAVSARGEVAGAQQELDQACAARDDAVAELARQEGQASQARAARREQGHSPVADLRTVHRWRGEQQALLKSIEQQRVAVHRAQSVVRQAVDLQAAAMERYRMLELRKEKYLHAIDQLEH